VRQDELNSVSHARIIRTDVFFPYNKVSLNVSLDCERNSVFIPYEDEKRWLPDSPVLLYNNKFSQITCFACYLSLLPLVWLTLRTLRWRRRFPPKRRLTFNGLHSIISQKTELIVIVVLCLFIMLNEMPDCHVSSWFVQLVTTVDDGPVNTHGVSNGCRAHRLPSRGWKMKRTCMVELSQSV
jgi:hypothetical protein